MLVCAALVELLHHLQVTHRKLLDSEARLLEADRRKNEFLAMLAHELRNPLASILNIAPILGRRAYEPSTVRQMSGVLLRQASHLARLVDDLLDVARITRGKIELRPQSLVVQEVIEHALEVARPLIAARQQSVAFDPPPQPLKVDADPVRLTQVIGNLLSNAAKFSPDGARIQVTAAQVDGAVQIGVRDEGAGIDAQILPHVFDLFVQGDQSLDRSQGGLGIGLTVAKRLVELHGGRIEVRSDGPGRGSEFTIVLPTGMLPDNLEGAPLAPMTSRRILIVDDNADSAMSLSVLLEMEGHEVRSARTGTGGVADARTVRRARRAVGHRSAGTRWLCDGGSHPAAPWRCHAISRCVIRVRSADESRAGFDAHLMKPLELARLGEILVRLPVAQPPVLSR